MTANQTGINNLKLVLHGRDKLWDAKPNTAKKDETPSNKEAKVDCRNIEKTYFARQAKHSWWKRAIGSVLVEFMAPSNV